VTTRAARSLLAATGAAGATALAALAAPVGGADPIRPRGRPTLTLAAHVLRPAARLAPGDRVVRRVDLRYGARGRFEGVVLVTTAQRSSPLDADPAHGLTATLDRCSVRWIRRGRDYRCAGKRWRTLPRVPVIGRRRLTRLSLAPGKTDHLRLTLVLPARAGNGLQGRTSTLVFRLIGTARR
jgi:hypothetical protein